MNIREITQIIKEIGMPGALLIWLIFINDRNQRCLTKKMEGVQKAIMDLTVCIREAAIYMTAKGGEYIGHKS